MAYLACCKRRAGPLRLDVHQSGKIKESSLARYRKAVQPFVRFLRECDVRPCGAEQWDDMLVEWKNASLCTKSDFEGAPAGLEFSFPRFRCKLAWSLTRCLGWMGGMLQTQAHRAAWAASCSDARLPSCC